MTTKNTIARIAAILETRETPVSAEARDYLQDLLDREMNVQDLAQMTSGAHAGICVVDEGQGDFVHYGDYPAFFEGNVSYLDCSWMDISDILNVMEANDSVPSWWEDGWTFVEGRDGWTTRDDLPEDEDDTPEISEIKFVSATLTEALGQLHSTAVFEIDGERFEHSTCNEIEFLEKLENFGGTSFAGTDYEQHSERLDYEQMLAICFEYDSLAELLAAIAQHGEVTVDATE